MYKIYERHFKQKMEYPRIVEQIISDFKNDVRSGVFDVEGRYFTYIKGDTRAYALDDKDQALELEVIATLGIFEAEIEDLFGLDNKDNTLILYSEGEKRISF